MLQISAPISIVASEWDIAVVTRLTTHDTTYCSCSLKPMNPLFGFNLIIYFTFYIICPSEVIIFCRGASDDCICPVFANCIFRAFQGFECLKYRQATCSLYKVLPRFNDIKWFRGLCRYFEVSVLKNDFFRNPPNVIVRFLSLPPPEV